MQLIISTKRGEKAVVVVEDKNTKLRILEQMTNLNTRLMKILTMERNKWLDSEVIVNANRTETMADLIIKGECTEMTATMLV